VCGRLRHAQVQLPLQGNYVSEDKQNSNLILAALPSEEQSLFLSHAAVVPLEPGQELYEPNQRIRSVWFPTLGVVCLLTTLENGATAEVGMIGREGFVGVPVVLGGQSSPFRAVVQVGGAAYSVSSDVLLRILPRAPKLDLFLRRCALSRFFQIAQCAACNSLHEMPQRLARWLLLCRDKARSDLLPVTQELLGQMLGCRRASVTIAEQLLRDTGAIRYFHGKVQITDHEKLQRAACECYQLIQQFGQFQ
jgi:CRP-like cAMP-binding protein